MPSYDILKNVVALVQDYNNVIGEFHYPVTPVPKERPDKWGKTPLKTRQYERIITQMTREQQEGAPFTGRAIMCVSFGVPALRGDTDNLIKALQDGMQGVAFEHDSHIDGYLAYRYKSAKPEISVSLYDTATLNQAKLKLVD